MLLYYFYFQFLFFEHTCHTNFYFNWCSVFTECPFWLWKRFKWSKSLLVRFSPPNSKFLFSIISHPAHLGGNFPLLLWKTLNQHRVFKKKWYFLFARRRKCPHTSNCTRKLSTHMPRLKDYPTATATATTATTTTTTATATATTTTHHRKVFRFCFFFVCMFYMFLNLFYSCRFGGWPVRLLFLGESN